MNVKSCLTKLIAFFNEIASLVDEESGVSVVYPDSCKAFHNVSHNILIDKLMKYGLDERQCKVD